MTIKNSHFYFIVMNFSIFYISMQNIDCAYSLYAIADNSWLLFILNSIVFLSVFFVFFRFQKMFVGNFRFADWIFVISNFLIWILTIYLLCTESFSNVFFKLSFSLIEYQMCLLYHSYIMKTIENHRKDIDNIQKIITGLLLNLMLVNLDSKSTSHTTETQLYNLTLLNCKIIIFYNFIKLILFILDIKLFYQRIHHTKVLSSDFILYLLLAFFDFWSCIIKYNKALIILFVYFELIIISLKNFIFDIISETQSNKDEFITDNSQNQHQSNEENELKYLKDDELQAKLTFFVNNLNQKKQTAKMLIEEPLNPPKL